ncbi:MAG: neutral ceramidase [Thermoleophilaceae bacterium]|nr:neutral ceramidase [Thermoleophilaceae bacterium]
MLLAAIFVAVPISAAHGADYEVGVAKADITWHVDASAPSSTALTFSGLASRLWAKAIVVKRPGAKPFAFVRTDTLLITGDLYEGVLQRVARTTGLAPERVLLAATHTHTGNNGLYPHPVHSALYRSFAPAEREFIADRVAQAIEQAYKHTRPATLAAGSTHLSYVEFNRRYTENEKLNKSPRPTDRSKLDPEIGVLRFDDARTGKPFAVLMNHGVHPVVTINEPLLSSDLVGYAERALEHSFRRTGAHPMAIWFTGAQGDQDPIHVRYSYPEAEWAGGVLGRAAGRLAVRLKPAPITSARIIDKLIPLPGPGNDEPSLGEEGVGRVPVVAPASFTVPSSVRLQVIELGSSAGGKTALMTWPGEPIRDIGVYLKQHAHTLGYDHAYVFALADDWAGYWLTPKEYDRQRYEWTLMFYGRESAPYVENNVLDLVKALATGSKPTDVPLPPQAVADRQFTAASAASGAPPAETPPDDPDPGITTDVPPKLPRGQVVRLEWSGGSPLVARDWFPRVSVERRSGSGWKLVAREGAEAVLLKHEGGSVWSARWQPLYSTPRGTYRIRVVGNRQAGGVVPYALTSKTFAVTPCVCIDSGSSGGSSNGRITMTLGYAPGPKDGFRRLEDWVRTGRHVVRVMRGKRLVGHIVLRYRPHIVKVTKTVTVHDLSGEDLPITFTAPVDRGAFVGRWKGAPGLTFVSGPDRDGYGNS